MSTMENSNAKILKIFEETKFYGFLLSDEWIQSYLSSLTEKQQEAEKTTAGEETGTVSAVKRERLNFQSAQQLREYLLNSDLRRSPSVVKPYFPVDILSGQKSLSLQGPVVLQILSVSNIAGPSKRKYEDGHPKFLLLSLTDGHTKVYAVEIESIPGLKSMTSPGTKILYLGGEAVKGKILLSSSNTKLIGGEVPHLVEAFLANINALKYRELQSGSKGAKLLSRIQQPPKFEFTLSPSMKLAPPLPVEKAAKMSVQEETTKPATPANNTQAQDSGGKNYKNNKQGVQNPHSSSSAVNSSNTEVKKQQNNRTEKSAGSNNMDRNPVSQGHNDSTGTAKKDESTQGNNQSKRSNDRKNKKEQQGEVTSSSAGSNNMDRNPVSQGHNDSTGTVKKDEGAQGNNQSKRSNDRKNKKEQQGEVTSSSAGANNMDRNPVSQDHNDSTGTVKKDESTQGNNQSKRSNDRKNKKEQQGEVTSSAQATQQPQSSNPESTGSLSQPRKARQPGEQRTLSNTQPHLASAVVNNQSPAPPPLPAPPSRPSQDSRAENQQLSKNQSVTPPQPSSQEDRSRKQRNDDKPVALVSFANNQGVASSQGQENRSRNQQSQKPLKTDKNTEPVLSVPPSHPILSEENKTTKKQQNYKSAPVSDSVDESILSVVPSLRSGNAEAGGDRRQKKQYPKKNKVPVEGSPSEEFSILELSSMSLNAKNEKSQPRQQQQNISGSTAAHTERRLNTSFAKNLITNSLGIRTGNPVSPNESRPEVKTPPDLTVTDVEKSQQLKNLLRPSGTASKPPAEMNDIQEHDTGMEKQENSSRGGGRGKGRGYYGRGGRNNRDGGRGH
jgi:hypothetical protein